MRRLRRRGSRICALMRKGCCRTPRPHSTPEGFGMCSDRFGVHWMVGLDGPQP
jgi:uncharacterized glyoxalase superfamily protein PhnB